MGQAYSMVAQAISVQFGPHSNPRWQHQEAYSIFLLIIDLIRKCVQKVMEAYMFKIECHIL
jgi:hypothetical protein